MRGSLRRPGDCLRPGSSAFARPREKRGAPGGVEHRQRPRPSYLHLSLGDCNQSAEGTQLRTQRHPRRQRCGGEGRAARLRPPAETRAARCQGRDRRNLGCEPRRHRDASSRSPEPRASASGRAIRWRSVRPATSSDRSPDTVRQRAAQRRRRQRRCGRRGQRKRQRASLHVNAGAGLLGARQSATVTGNAPTRRHA